MRLRGIAQVDILEVVFARTLNRDLEIVRDVRDISYQRTIVFDQRRLFDLPAQEGVAGHHLFDDDLTVLALAGFRRPLRLLRALRQSALPPQPHPTFHLTVPGAHGHARAKSVPRIPEHTTKFERLFDGVSGRKTEP